jgi:hypothetical protein
MMQCDPNLRCYVRGGARKSITGDRYQVNFWAELVDLTSVQDALEKHSVGFAMLVKNNASTLPGRQVSAACSFQESGRFRRSLYFRRRWLGAVL